LLGGHNIAKAQKTKGEILPATDPARKRADTEDRPFGKKRPGTARKGPYRAEGEGYRF